MSTDNSAQILNDVLDQQREELFPEKSKPDYFEIFCAEQILKNHNLSYEEIEEGIVDGEHDGGIDSVYTFINEILITEEVDKTLFKKDALIELHIIQSKTSGGFSEIALNKLMSATYHLLNLSTDYNNLTQYNEKLKERFDIFRQSYRALASKFPKLHIYYYYASQKSDNKIHDNLRKKAAELKDRAESFFQDSEAYVEFLGANELLRLARRRPTNTFVVPVYKSINANNSHIALISLKDYNLFLRDDNNNIRQELFESNVRDFQGNTAVNDEISKTLREDQEIEFWWMNNGVTILARRATLNGDFVTLENPQIVNGLQTSTQVARFCDTASSNESRHILVKIISSEDDESRDKIIKATNTQNPVQSATLRATDKIQRDIESTLLSADLFYDRRKNFYKNEGKSATKIISIPLMAQSIISIILGQPNSARARPSSLIKDDDVYGKVFSERHPVGMYTTAARLIQRVDRVLKSHTELTGRDRANIRFYVLFWVCCQAAGRCPPSPTDLACTNVSEITDGHIENAIDAVWQEFSSLGSTDKAAKGQDLVKNLTVKLKITPVTQEKIPAEEKKIAVAH